MKKTKKKPNPVQAGKRKPPAMLSAAQLPMGDKPLPGMPEGASFEDRQAARKSRPTTI